MATRDNDPFNLERFKVAQKRPTAGFDAAMGEIRSGRKTGHWIWYIFPQMRGLGTSENSTFYGISGRDEAAAYAADPLLYDRLIEAAQALLDRPESVIDIMGSLDALKVQSCMKLFESVTHEPVFKKVLNKIY